jgi:hypothetical protein
MIDRKAALRSVGVGDIFHVEEESGPTRVCLATSVTEHLIVARSITTQDILKFDRHSGVATQQFHGVNFDWVIKSVARLPPDIHEIMLGLDRRFREAANQGAKDPRWDEPSEDTRLTQEQIRGLLFLDDFYSANPV